MLFLITCCGFSLLAFSNEEVENIYEQSDVYLYDSQVTLANDDGVYIDRKKLTEDDMSGEYEEVEQHGMENADKYTLDDILAENSKYSNVTETEILPTCPPESFSFVLVVDENLSVSRKDD